MHSPTIKIIKISRVLITCGNIVVEAHCYKSEGRGLDFQCDLFFFFFFFNLANFSSRTIGPEVYSAFNRNEYKKQKRKMFLASKAWPEREADNLTTICEPIV
jgi:hypothetical protein